MWDLIFNKYMIFLMVFIRMCGMILFNPLFGRKNIPVNIKMGLSFFTAMIITNTITGVDIQFAGMLDFMLAGLKELFVGFTMSFIAHMTLSSALVAGELADLQLGVSMSRVYDPSSNTSMPLTGTIFNLLFVILFFAGNGHLTLIRILALTFKVMPPGNHYFNAESGEFIVSLLANVLVLAIKLALPIIAIEMITEIALGILMRSVPQINVFVVGIQFKVIIGLIVIILILPQAANLFDYQINQMFDNIQKCIKLMAAS